VSQCPWDPGFRGMPAGDWSPTAAKTDGWASPALANAVAQVPDTRSPPRVMAAVYWRRLRPPIGISRTASTSETNPPPPLKPNTTYVAAARRRVRCCRVATSYSCHAVSSRPQVPAVRAWRRLSWSPALICALRRGGAIERFIPLRAQAPPFGARPGGHVGLERRSSYFAVTTIRRAAAEGSPSRSTAAQPSFCRRTAQ
jgi:hypothetical protein